MRRPFVLFVAFALPIPVASRAQGSTSPVPDSIGPVFRSVIDSVGATAGLPSLHDGALPSSAQREIRAYIGFGLTYPQQIARIWRDASGVHGWLGLWWPGTRLRYEIANATDADYAKARREQATWTAQVREVANRAGCTDFRVRPNYETCTLPTPAVSWLAVLARLDSLGIGQLPPQRDRLGLDGVTLVVEYRDAAQYRAYSYWMPSVKSAEPNERAAASIMQTITGLTARAGSP